MSKPFFDNIVINEALPPDTVLLVSPSSVPQQPSEDQRAYAERLAREGRVVKPQAAAERAREHYTAHRATLDVPEWVPAWESLTVQQQRFVMEHLPDAE